MSDLEDKCIVKDCTSSTTNLFCSPTDEDLLKKWQTVLGIKDEYFLICEKHFSEKDFVIEKCLEVSAVPTLDVTEKQFNVHDKTCGMCLEISQKLIMITKQSADVFKEVSGYKPATQSSCESCQKFIENYQHFKSKVREKHKALNTVGGQPESDEDCIVLVDDELPGPREKDSEKLVSIPRFPADIVSKKFTAPKEVRVPKRVGCKHCYYKATDRISLIKHIDENHNFSCDNCLFISTSEPLLQLHRKKIHPNSNSMVICGLCDANFECKKDASDHFEKNHASLKCSFFMCSYCKVNCTNADDLKYHYKQQHDGGFTSAQDQINNTKLQMALLSEKTKVGVAADQNYSNLMQKLQAAVTVTKIAEGPTKKVRKKTTALRGPFTYELPLNTPIKISEIKGDILQRHPIIARPLRQCRDDVPPSQKITEVTIVSSQAKSQYVQEQTAYMDSNSSTSESEEETVIAEIIDDEPICLDSDSDEVEIVPKTVKKKKPEPLNKVISGRINTIKIEGALMRGFKCLSCNLHFEEITQLLAHREEAHPPEKKQYEKFDMTQMPIVLQKKRKSNEVEDNEQIPCHICATLVKRKYLPKHLNRLHAEKEFLCHLCSMTFSDNTAFRYHMMKHDPTSLFQCDMCPRGYVTKGRLAKHIKKMHLRMLEIKATCGICKKKIYKQHKSTATLESHMKKYHPDGKDDGYRVNEETNYFDCNRCGASYWDAYTFQRHSCDKGRNQLKCPECHKPCATQQTLAKHKLTKCRKLNPFLNSVNQSQIDTVTSQPPPQHLQPNLYYY